MTTLIEKTKSGVSGRARRVQRRGCTQTARPRNRARAAQNLRGPLRQSRQRRRRLPARASRKQHRRRRPTFGRVYCIQVHCTMLDEIANQDRTTPDRLSRRKLRRDRNGAVTSDRTRAVQPFLSNTSRNSDPSSPTTRPAASPKSFAVAIQSTLQSPASAPRISTAQRFFAKAFRTIRKTTPDLFLLSASTEQTLNEPTLLVKEHAS